VGSLCEVSKGSRSALLQVSEPQGVVPVIGLPPSSTPLSSVHTPKQCGPAPGELVPPLLQAATNSRPATEMHRKTLCFITPRFAAESAGRPQWSRRSTTHAARRLARGWLAKAILLNFRSVLETSGMWAWRLPRPRTLGATPRSA
jgi:hypothetical protein